MKRNVIAVIFAGFAALAVLGCSPAPTPGPPTVTPAPPVVAQPTVVVAQVTTAPQPTDAPHPTPTRTAQPTATSNAAAGPSGQPYDVLTNAMKAQFDSKSFRATLKVTTADGKTSNILQEYVAPDRYHMLTDQVEIISVGSDSWMKTGGTWTKAPVNFLAMVKSFHDPATLATILKSITINGVQLVGPDVVGGTPTWVFQYTTTVSLGAGLGDIKGQSKIWIGIADGLPYKLESDSDSILVKGGKDHTSAVYEYNANISIQPPI